MDRGIKKYRKPGEGDYLKKRPKRDLTPIESGLFSGNKYDVETHDDIRSAAGAAMSQYSALGKTPKDKPMAYFHKGSLGFTPKGIAAIGITPRNYGVSPGDQANISLHEATHYLTGEEDYTPSQTPGMSHYGYTNIPMGDRGDFPFVRFGDQNVQGRRSDYMNTHPRYSGAEPIQGWPEAKYPENPGMGVGNELGYTMAREGLLGQVLMEGKLDSDKQSKEYQDQLKSEFPILARLYSLFAGKPPDAYDYVDKPLQIKRLFDPEVNKKFAENYEKRYKQEEESGFPNTEESSIQRILRKKYKSNKK